MIVKCPQCSTGYNIPDNVLTDKPRKMRCAKCKNLFTVARRSDIPHDGYTEFTGSQQLPNEFTFLKANEPAKKESQAEQHREHAVKPPQFVNIDSSEDTSVGPAPQPPEKIKTSNNKVILNQDKQKNVPVAASKNKEFIPQHDELQDTPSQKIDTKLEDSDQKQGGSIPKGQSIPAETMFGHGSSAWEVEAPLDLSSYSIAEKPEHTAAQTVGKIIFLLGLMIIGILIFISYRNDWNLSFFELPEQIGFAFSDEATDHLPDAVSHIDVTILDKKIIMSEQNNAYLVVAGEVVNNNPGSREHIIIRGKLYDGDGNFRVESRLPCSKIFEDKAIKRISKNAIKSRFMKDNKLINCSIAPNDSTLFQIIFENIPDDYNATFTVKIQAVAATTGG